MLQPFRPLATPWAILPLALFLIFCSDFANVALLSTAVFGYLYNEEPQP